jgi:NADH-quinone oxidoreductase subunit A
VFDVEVAFFFPWASVYGGAMQLADHRLSSEARTQISEKLLNVTPGTLDASQAISAETALQLGTASMIDILVFFAVLMVGFAYVWKRGDLDWVRAYQKPVPVEQQA